MKHQLTGVWNIFSFITRNASIELKWRSQSHWSFGVYNWESDMRRSYGVVMACVSIAAGAAPISSSFAQSRPSADQRPAVVAQNLPELRHSDSQSDSQRKAAPGGTSVNTTFGDWVLKCQPPNGQNPKMCELTQLVVEKEKKTPFAQIALGRLKPDEPLQVTLVAPTNVSFGSAARIATDDKDPHPVDLGWARCLPNACYASAQLKDEVIKSWLPKTQIGHVFFLNGGGQVTAIPISFKGLGPAIDALNQAK